MNARGASEEEVRDAIHTEEWNPAKKKRMDCRKNFEYNKVWGDKFYATKQVRPIFKDLGKGILVIIVYTYYF